MVGFGGGSTYAAILTFIKTDYQILPLIVLTCNLVVVTSGTLLFIKRKLLQWSLAVPLTVFSIPLAWLGGSLNIDREYFVLILGVSLLASGITLLFENSSHSKTKKTAISMWLLGPLVGAPLGMLAGIVGIGGGIFLAPILHHLKVASAKTISATASFFILVNSIAGLAGQLSKHSLNELPWDTLAPAGWLIVAVFAGGQIGSRLNNSRLSNLSVKRLTAILIIYVSLRLLFNAYRHFV